jgi:hypothetical protein
MVSEMRIHDDEGNALESVYLALSEAEARELAGALADLSTAQKGWHAHVTDAGSGSEVTVYREDDESAAF